MFYMVGAYATMPRMMPVRKGTESCGPSQFRRSTGPLGKPAGRPLTSTFIPSWVCSGCCSPGCAFHSAGVMIVSFLTAM